MSNVCLHERVFMIKNSIQLFLVALFLSSCQKIELKKRPSDLARKQEEAELLQESVARLSDIPDVPLPVIIKKITYAQQDSDQLQICCEMAGIDAEELCSYYEAGMERLGWSLQSSCNAQERLLVFVKPGGSLCVISLRDNQGMVITMMKKKDLS